MFGVDGITLEQNKLGIGVHIHSKTSMFQETISKAEVCKSEVPQSFDIVCSFPKGKLRGKVYIETFFYIKELKKTFPTHADLEGMRVSQKNISELVLIIDGDGSMFPIGEFEDKNGPLWKLKLGNFNASEDLFSYDNISILLNTAHSLFRQLNERKTALSRGLMMEIVSQAMTLIINKVMEEREEAEIDTDISDGTILSMVDYWISVFDVDTSDTVHISNSLRIALEQILTDLGKEVELFCPVDIPKYLRYFNGWDRVSDNLWKSDLYIIVDTTSSTLLSKILENPLYKNLLEKNKVVVIDHHTDATPDLPFEYSLLLENRSSCSEVIFELCKKSGWQVNELASSSLMGAILSDTLGFTTQNVSKETFITASELTSLGAKVSSIEESRREFMKKAPEILEYKGDLIKRIEYFLGGKLALIHIPWDEIRQYSDKYNPSVLVIDEMRLVEGVEVCVAVKTYPDGKVTGKVRTNLPIAADIAGYFGGGGHAYASGFRVYDNYDQIIKELLDATEKALEIGRNNA